MPKQSTTQPVIYTLVDPETGEKRYIGKADNPQKRLWYHVYNAQHGEKTHKANWIRQLLERNQEPVLRILEVVASDQNWQERERWWIQRGRDLGWLLTNATDGGEGSVGYIPTPETCAKISAANKGRKLPPCSEEHRAKLSAANMGRKPSPETCAKISAANTGVKRVPLSEEHRAKISAAKTGRVLSKEHRAKISAGQIGRTHSKETRAKISAANKGRVLSEETRAKMSAARKGRVFSEEWRARIGIANRGENNSSAKLTEDDVREIRRLYATGNWTYKQLADYFNVAKPTVGHIIRCETWKHIKI